jgi:hypothetical protein
MSEPLATDIAKPSESAPVADETPPAAPKVRKKREPVTTLTAFFEQRAVKPATFLKDLREAEVWSFEAEDVETALASHADRDKDFGRTVQLVAAALKERDARFATVAVEFAERAIRRRFRDNPYAIGVDLGDAPTVEEALARTVRVLAPRLRETKRRTESTNLLLGKVLCLNHAGGLPADTAMDTLVAALGPEAASRSGDTLRSKLVWLASQPKDVRNVIELLAPWARSTGDLAMEADRLRGSLESERDARRAADAEVVRLSAQLADLEKTLTQARNEIERLEEAARAVGLHADHDVKSARARVAGQLDGQLRDLVTTVDEALSVDPPRVDVAREKAEVLMRELERQVAWLRS